MSVGVRQPEATWGPPPESPSFPPTQGRVHVPFFPSWGRPHLSFCTWGLVVQKFGRYVLAKATSREVREAGFSLGALARSGQRRKRKAEVSQGRLRSARVSLGHVFPLENMPLTWRQGHG